MKVLFYLDPWIEMGKPDYKDPVRDFLYQPLMEALLDRSVFGDSEIVLMVGDAQEHGYIEFCEKNNIRLIVIAQKELRQFAKNDAQWFASFYPVTSNENLLADAKKLFADKLQGFSPDIIVPYSFPVPFFSELFPKALVFQCESGFSTRAPFPISIFLDPFGSLKNSYIKNYEKELLSLEMTDEKTKWLDRFRDRYIDELIEKKSPFADLNLREEYGFKRFVLLPLQFSGHFLFDLHCDFNNQFQFLCYVMENISSDVGVIVTEHCNETYGDFISASVGHYMEKKYPNFIFLKDTRKYQSSSQYLLSKVDGIITVQSSVAIQALLWKKPVFTVGDSYITAISENVEIDQIGHFLSSSDYQNKDAVLYHLLTRYYIPSEHYLFDAKWLKSFFGRAITIGKTNLDFDFYNEIDNTERLLSYYLSHSRDCLPVKANQTENYKEYWFHTRMALEEKEKQLSKLKKKKRFRKLRKKIISKVKSFFVT